MSVGAGAQVKPASAHGPSVGIVSNGAEKCTRSKLATAGTLNARDPRVVFVPNTYQASPVHTSAGSGRSLSMTGGRTVPPADTGGEGTATNPIAISIATAMR